MPMLVRLFLPLLLLAVVVSPVRAQGVENADVDSRSVLLVGNSYIFFNNLPDMLEGISMGLGGPRLSVESHTHPGYSLQRHLDDGHLDGIFERRSDWDFVVLQENSRFSAPFHPVTGELGSNEGFKEAVRVFDDRVKALGADPVLFMTWAKQPWPDQIVAISDAYLEIGQEVDADVSVVGLAWAVALEERPELDLHVSDGSHPTPAGSYLTACVLYATLTGRSPEGAPRELWGSPWHTDGLMASDESTLLALLSPDDAAFLQTVAWKTVSEHKARNK
jgi:hypothetical protein